MQLLGLTRLDAGVTVVGTNLTSSTPGLIALGFFCMEVGDSLAPTAIGTTVGATAAVIHALLGGSDTLPGMLPHRCFRKTCCLLG